MIFIFELKNTVSADRAVWTTATPPNVARAARWARPTAVTVPRVNSSTMCSADVSPLITAHLAIGKGTSEVT